MALASGDSIKTAGAAAKRRPEHSINSKAFCRPTTHTERCPYLPYHFVLSITLVSGFVSAFLATISDCDEVFNYWEPTHYLSHGHGLQTWEYSPVYAIRSWLYVGLHSLLAWPFTTLLGIDKTSEFLILRGILAATSSIAQAELFDALSRFADPDIGIFFVLISVPSAGMFQAMPAYLPSSFAMNFVMFGTAAFLRNVRSPARALLFFAIAGLLGWPFSLALVLPQLFFWAWETSKHQDMASILGLLFWSLPGPLVVLALVTFFDSLAYRKIVFVPLSIVLYNVFGGEGRGPDLYGTEPWWYYLANLSLNFNVMAVAALLSGSSLFLLFD
ncbi:hypothetical protein DRE_04717 [Drechslerella stenobrocha 248]|uniref:Mannosyltransferase n=1 Tax=Drechslerella stenobrocha 248 TaxID=1043628 RepID=W7I1N2_9PEZI|nr:hypothetical protein DRE_04717 [Drechslerella stenobrocha 248]